MHRDGGHVTILGLYIKRGQVFKYSCRLCKWIYCCQHVLWVTLESAETIFKALLAQSKAGSCLSEEKTGKNGSLRYSHGAIKMVWLHFEKKTLKFFSVLSFLGSEIIFNI